MLRRASIAACCLLLACGVGSFDSVQAQDSPKELKELDKLEGYDQLRDEKSVKKDLTNAPKQPIESIIVWSEAEPGRGKAPLTVQFAADPPAGVDGPVYTWQFGDGSAASQGQTVSHTFVKPGVYRVLLQVTNAKGALGEDELRVKVE